MEGLSPIDAWAAVAILAKAFGYVAALLAIGGVLFAATFRDAPEDVTRLARRMAALAACAGLLILASRIGIRSARISGMGVEGALDPMLLGLVWDSPLGDAALWRAGGEILILTVLMRGGVWRALSLAGAAAVAASFTLVGHSLDGPRVLMVSMLVIHVIAAAFWVGALLPLHRAAGSRTGAALLHRFGRLASFGVAALALAGLTLAWVTVGSVAGLFGTAYGWMLVAKLSVVCLLLALAASNKLRLVPALAQGEAHAPARLRRSIRLELWAVAAIALLTAALTSVTVPPFNL